MEITDKDRVKKLWWILLACLSIAMLKILLDPSFSTFIIYLAIFAASIYLVINHRTSLEKIDYIAALIFTTLTAIAVNPQMPFYYFVASITFMAYLGAMATNHKYHGQIQLVSSQPLKGLAITIVVAAIFSFINVMLPALSGQNPHLNLSLNAMLGATRFATVPGITEEILMRFIPYALAIQTLKSAPVTKKESMITYLIMILPHALMHFHLSQMNPISILVSTIILSLCFGLPMALLLRKISLSSAILLHFLVDFVRYLFFQG